MYRVSLGHRYGNHQMAEALVTIGHWRQLEEGRRMTKDDLLTCLLMPQVTISTTSRYPAQSFLCTWSSNSDLKIAYICKLNASFLPFSGGVGAVERVLELDDVAVPLLELAVVLHVELHELRQRRELLAAVLGGIIQRWGDFKVVRCERRNSLHS